MKKTLNRLYLAGKFDGLTDEQILAAWGDYITQADLDEWKNERNQQ